MGWFPLGDRVPRAVRGTPKVIQTRRIPNLFDWWGLRCAVLSRRPPETEMPRHAPTTFYSWLPRYVLVRRIFFTCPVKSFRIPRTEKVNCHPLCNVSYLILTIPHFHILNDGVMDSWDENWLCPNGEKGGSSRPILSQSRLYPECIATSSVAFFLI